MITNVIGKYLSAASVAVTATLGGLATNSQACDFDLRDMFCLEDASTGADLRWCLAGLKGTDLVYQSDGGGYDSRAWNKATRQILTDATERFDVDFVKTTQVGVMGSIKPYSRGVNLPSDWIHSVKAGETVYGQLLTRPKWARAEDWEKSPFFAKYYAEEADVVQVKLSIKNTINCFPNVIGPILPGLTP